jgi:cytochrome bd-type quinol oxidase subunit 1
MELLGSFFGSPVLTNVLLMFTAIFLEVIVLTLLQFPYDVVEEVGHLLVTRW